MQKERLCISQRSTKRTERLHVNHGSILFWVSVMKSFILLAFVSVSQPRGDAPNSIWNRLRQITRGRKKFSSFNSIVNASSTTIHLANISRAVQNSENVASNEEGTVREMNIQKNDENNVASIETDDSISLDRQNPSDVPLLDSFDLLFADEQNEEENTDDDDNFRFFPDWRQRNNKNSESKNKFLERISIMLSTLFGRDIDAAILPSEKLRQVMLNQFSIGKPNISLTSTNVDEDDSLLDSVTPQSDLSLPGRYIHIVTTAALPWFTGTAVNPLLRAAYLHRRTIEINKQYEQEDKSNEARKQIHFHHNRSYVTLVIPWLELKEDQIELYNNRVFESSAQQEEYIRDWLRTEAKMEDAADNLEILFYPARYHSGLRSVFAMGDIMDVVPPANRDVCILEEPEHCNCKWVLVDEADIFFCC
jgi:hypothetical protein